MIDFLALLPFEWTGYAFMRLAFVAILMMAPLYALLGTMVVESRMAFFSDSLGHSALTGIGIGVLLGFKTPLWSMLIFGVLYAVIMMAVSRSGAASLDTTIGVFSSSAIALGIVLLSRGGGFARYSWYLVGDILAITPQDLWILLLTLGLVVLYWLFGYNRLLLVSLNPPLAKSRGIRYRLIEMIFAVVLALVVMASIQWVGVMMINALLILPAACARNISPNVRRYHLWAVLISLGCGVAGLLCSYYWGTASGATIVLLLAVSYCVTLVVRRVRPS